MMRFREGDRVVMNDPHGRYDHDRGRWCPHGEIGGTVVCVNPFNYHDDTAYNVLVHWDEDALGDRNWWIIGECLDLEEHTIMSDDVDKLCDFLSNE